MDLMNRGGRSAQPSSHPAAPANAGSAPVSQANNRRAKAKGLPLHRISLVVLLFAATVVVAGLLWRIMLVQQRNEAQFVDNKKMQAVFLNGGQVYFGRIQSLNPDYVRLSDIYYLRVNQQVQPNQQQNQQAKQDISLVKLGCELHGPQDQMLINRSQVVFWENLKDDGQVAKAVAEYLKNNPGEQKCETNNQQQSSTPTAPAAQNNQNQNANNR